MPSGLGALVISPSLDSFGGSAPSSTQPVAVAGITHLTSAAVWGTPLGSPAMVLPHSLDAVVRPADQALSLSALNALYNPLASVIGDLPSPSDVFRGKALLPTRQLFGSMPGVSNDVLEALPEVSVLRTPAHQFNVDGALGNRVVFYGGTLGSTDLDTLAITLGDQGIRLIKQMTHFTGGAQGGTPQDILKDGVGGSTHAGGYSSGFIAGTASSVKTDWPANYARLADYNADYNATLFGIDYQGGVRTPIPPDVKLAYKHNADMWDAVLGAVVPFSTEDPMPRFTESNYNPLDVYDQASLKSLATDAATLDWSTFKLRHGAFYCAEGQYAVANLGPQDATLLKKSAYGNTPLGGWVEAFAKAPEYAGQTAEFRRTHPELGWQHLLKTGLLSQAMYDRLKQGDRLGVALEWVPETVPGWQKYQPIETNGLVATPLTVAGLAWSLLRRYLPREEVSQTLSDAVQNGYATGTDAQRAAIEEMLGGLNPTSPAGHQALDGLGFKTATAFTATILGQPAFRARLFAQAGVNEILEPTPAEVAAGYVGKAAVNALFDRFVTGFTTAKSQTELDAHLKALDSEMRQFKVIRAGADAANPRKDPVLGLMLYSPPQGFTAWAQSDTFSGGTTVFRYVAQAMHVGQRK